MKKTWFITGTSSGFGRLWAEAALERGDQVVATARKPAALDDLAERFPGTILPLELDVTDRKPFSRPSTARCSASGASTSS